MALTAFPEPKDLHLRYEDTITDGKNLDFRKWTVENPHPGYGKDPNILNCFGHTMYPKWVSKPDGERVIVANAEEEAAITGEHKPVVWETEKLRDDGPTIQEFMAAGYKAKFYPPQGYAAKSSQEEVDAAIEAEEAAEASASKGWGNHASK